VVQTTEMSRKVILIIECWGRNQFFVLWYCSALKPEEAVIFAGMRRIAISDIHGCSATFRKLLQRIALKPEDHLYLLGDYIDRGPDSKGVLDIIFSLIEAGHQVTCLKGNHEQGLEWALHDIERFEHWLYWGGDATLGSFGASHPSQIPEQYLNFLFDLPLYAQVEQWILVHAGLNFQLADPLSDPHALLWIRNWYEQIDYQWLGQRYIVHGHQRITVASVLAMFTQLDQLRVIDIDSGCFDVATPGAGHLCAFDLTHQQLYFEPNIDMVHPWMRH